MSVHFVRGPSGHIYHNQERVTFRKLSSEHCLEELVLGLLVDENGRVYQGLPEEIEAFLTESPADSASKAKVNSNFDAIYGSAKTSETGGRSSGVYDIHGQENTCGECIGPFFVGGDQIASTGISNSLIESPTQGFAFDHRSDTLRDFISNNPLKDWVDAAKRIREAFDALEG